MKSRRTPRRGMVLFIVTIVVALVSLSAYGFVVMMQTENRSAHLLADQLQAEQLAHSGVEYVRVWAAASRVERQLWGGMQQNSPLFRALAADIDPLGRRHGYVSVVVPRYAPPDIQPVYAFGIQNSSGKLSLSLLLTLEQQSPGDGRRALMQLPGMTETVADAILDWIDPDDERRESGAESEFYLGLDPPRQPPNRVPERLSDLLAVRGVTYARLFGTPAAKLTLFAEDGAEGPMGAGLPPRIGAGTSMRNSSISSASASGESTATPDAMGSLSSTVQAPNVPWAYYLTAVSAERNEAYDGAPRIQLNSENLTELHQELLAAFDQETANFVIAARQFGIESSGSESAQDGEIPSVTLTIAAAESFDSPLDLLDAVVAMPTGESSAIGSPNVVRYRSPLRTSDSAKRATVVDFCDRTTTEERPRLRGRINVQEAERPVLLALPGMTPEIADRLITSRQQSSVDEASRVSAAWLLAEEIVDLEVMKQLWPFVTVGGDVLEAQVVAYYDGDSPWMRGEVIVDGTREAVPTIFFQDLRRLGRGFSYASLRPMESTMSRSGVQPPGSALLRQMSGMGSQRE